MDINERQLFSSDQNSHANGKSRPGDRSYNTLMV